MSRTKACPGTLELGSESLAFRKTSEGCDRPSTGDTRIHPITWHQENLCEKMIAQEPSRSAWQTLTLGFAALVTPAADIRRLERAFRLLQMRHDVLRMNFVPVAGHWRAVIDPAPRATVTVEELGPKDAPARQSEVDSRFGRGFAPDGPPLSLTLLRFGSEGDVILLQVSHLVTDGFGASLISKDFVSALVGMPFGAAPLPYQDFARAYILRPKAELDAGHTYWSRLISPNPPPLIGLARTGQTTVDRYAENRSYAKVTTALSSKATRQVGTTAKRIGCPPFTLMASGFYEAIRSACGADTLDFGTMLGRNDARLERWSGQAVTNLHAVCRASDGPDVASRALALNDQIRESMTYLPHPAVQPQHALMQSYMARGGIPGRFRLRLPEYTPRFSKTSLFSALFSTDTPANMGKYSITRMRAGAISALSELTLAQSTERGQMQISLVYDTSGYAATEIESFAEQIKSAMINA